MNKFLVGGTIAVLTATVFLICVVGPVALLDYFYGPRVSVPFTIGWLIVLIFISGGVTFKTEDDKNEKI